MRCPLCGGSMATTTSPRFSMAVRLAWFWGFAPLAVVAAVSVPKLPPDFEHWTILLRGLVALVAFLPATLVLSSGKVIACTGCGYCASWTEPPVPDRRQIEEARNAAKT